MNKFILIKRGLCLATVSLLCVLLVACSGSKNVLANKKYLEGVREFNYGETDDLTVYQYLPENTTGNIIGYPYLSYKDDSDVIHFLSVLNREKEIFSGANEDVSFQIISCSLPYGYLQIKNDEEIALFDFLGNEILPFAKYGNDITVEARIDKSESISIEESRFIGYEKITYSIDDENFTKINELSFTSADYVYQTAIKNMTRKEIDSIDSYGKEGILIEDGYYIDLGLYGLDGYKMFTSDNSYNVYNENNELVTIIYPDAFASSSATGVMDGYMFTQTVINLPDDAKDYDCIRSGVKIKIVTESINLKNGKTKKIDNFDYLFSDINEMNYLVYEEDSSHQEVFVLCSNDALKIVDKELIPATAHIYFNAKGKILSTSTTYGLDAVYRLDESHYIGADDKNGIYWLLNDKLEKISCIKKLGYELSLAFGENPFNFSINTKAKMIITEFAGYSVIIDYDGKILTDLKYEGCTFTHGNNIIGLYDSKYWLIKTNEGTISSIEVIDCDFSSSISNASNINTKGKNRLLNEMFLLNSDYLTDKYDVTISAIDGTELVSFSCYGYNIRRVGWYGNVMLISALNEDGLIESVYILE